MAPGVEYPREYREEYETRFGVLERRQEQEQQEQEEQDLVSGWKEEVGEAAANLVEGGVQISVREFSVDVWVLGALEDIRNREEKAALVAESRDDFLDDAERSVLGAFVGLGEMETPELSRVVVDVEGVHLFREGFIPSSLAPSQHVANANATSTSPSAIAPEPFVNTPSTSKLLQSLATQLQRRQAVLISSPPSSGKSSTLTHLWSLLHSSSPSTSLPTSQARQRNLVVINLADRSLDSKSLLGSLSSAPASNDVEAGTFVFVEGPLTRAVRQGRWVVLTSIDQASIEVLSVVKVLAERMKRASEMAVGGSWGGGAGEEDGGVGVRVGGGEGRWVRAGKGFMLFGTRSLEFGKGARPAEPTFFGNHFWREVVLDAPGREEVMEIVKGRYERLREVGLGERLIEVWERVREVREREAKSGTARSIGVRDLMRSVLFFFLFFFFFSFSFYGEL